MNPTTEDPFGLRSHLGELRKRGHSGLVIAVAAILDTQLERCLKQAMRPLSKKVYAELFDPMRALGSFASKITVAYALRIISKDVYLVLEKVRKVRNAFAHSSQILHFDSEGIAPLFGQLKALVPPPPTLSPEQQFLECIQFIDDALDTYLQADPQRAV